MMSNRYQREIEEILQQAGELGNGQGNRGGREGLFGLLRRYIAQSIGGKTWSITPGRVMLVAMVLLLSALIMTSSVPGMVGPLAWAGLLLFIVGYAMFFIKPSKIEKRWRGQPIDDRGERWWERFRRKPR
ncbi:MAG: hypothetical protein QGI49_05310 [SAR202 cluster bacterium]|nr:hypothetical protein [SAR202 cluster bacterium]